MRRITAALSFRPASNLDLLCANPASLPARAAAVKGGSRDGGWGLGFYRGRLPAVVRGSGPARPGEKDLEKAASAVSRVVVAAQRETLNHGKRHGTAPITGPAQPFSAGGVIFAHDGELFIKDEIRALLGVYASKIKGGNGSEVLFWQTIKMLDAYGSPEKALEMALDEIRTVWISCKSGHPGLKAPCSGLSLFLASADSLTVLCHAPEKKNAPPAPGREPGRVAWRREKGRIIFSSGRAGAGRGWQKMNGQEIARAEVCGGKVLLKFKRIKL